MDKKKWATQLALYSSHSRESVEKMLNDNLQKVAELGYIYCGTKVWHSDYNGNSRWNAKLEYQVPLDLLTDDSIEYLNSRIGELKDYLLNPAHTIMDVGLIGMQALIVQSGVFELDLKESYGELRAIFVDRTGIQLNQNIGDLNLVPLSCSKINFGDEN